MICIARTSQYLFCMAATLEVSSLFICGKSLSSYIGNMWYSLNSHADWRPPGCGNGGPDNSLPCRLSADNLLKWMTWAWDTHGPVPLHLKFTIHFVYVSLWFASTKLKVFLYQYLEHIALQLMKAAVPAESYVIHLSSASLFSCDVYGQ